MRVDGGLAIVPNVVKAVEVARQQGFLVVWVLFYINISFFSFFLKGVVSLS